MAEHPISGSMTREGDGAWSFDDFGEWPDVGTARIRFVVREPECPQTRSSYLAIRDRWSELWPRIIERAMAMRASYDCEGEPIDLESDCFDVHLPSAPLSEDAAWSVMLQSESGWLLDFEGWRDAGGQGVF